mgnify:CR=1 FL=1
MAVSDGSEHVDLRDVPFQDLVREMLVRLGEDPEREGLRNTPKRVEKAMKFLTSGYQADVDGIINDALFTVDYSEMVVVKDIAFYRKYLQQHHKQVFFIRHTIR